MQVAAGYEARFRKTYSDAMKTHDRAPLSTPPFDVSADKDAAALRAKSVAACNSQGLKAVSPWLECYIAAQKDYLAAINIRDTDLSEAWFDALRAAAADGDAGKITNAQWHAAFDQLLKDNNAARARTYSDYLIATNGSTADAYVARYDEAYAHLAARSPKIPGDAPPMDVAAIKSARPALDAALAQCAAKRASFPSLAASLGCMLDAQKAYVVQIKMGDIALFDAYASVTREVAAETDSHKLNAVQSRVALEAILTEYNAKLTQQRADYQQRHGGGNSTLPVPQK